MPTYEYLCDEGHESVVTQRIVEDALSVCPKKKCSAECKRLISKCTFKLNGNGWTPKPPSYWMDTKSAPKD